MSQLTRSRLVMRSRANRERPCPDMAALEVFRAWDLSYKRWARLADSAKAEGPKTIAVQKREIGSEIGVGS
jgi:hypothetical protein